MAKDLGFSFGSRLEPYAIGQAAAVSEAMEQISAARLAAADLRQRAELALQSADEDRMRSAADAADWMARADELIAARNDSPTDFSWGRGLFYVSIGILLLVGDLTILSGVLAQLLDLPFRAKDEMGEFSVFNIVNDPVRAWDVFRNVIVLTSSRLLKNSDSL